MKKTILIISNFSKLWKSKINLILGMFEDVSQVLILLNKSS